MARREATDVVWICANCGARNDTDEMPCRECAGEQFARLEDPETGPIDSTATVTWVCDECGEPSPRNTTQCRNCGSFSYSKAADSQPSDDTTPAPTDDTDRRSITLPWLIAYGYGIMLVLASIGAVAFYDAIVPALCYLGSGLVAMPYTRSQLERAFEIEMSRAAIVTLAIVLYLAGGGLLLPSL